MLPSGKTTKNKYMNFKSFVGFHALKQVELDNTFKSEKLLGKDLRRFLSTPRYLLAGCQCGNGENICRFQDRLSVGGWDGRSAGPVRK